MVEPRGSLHGGKETEEGTEHAYLAGLSCFMFYQTPTLLGSAAHIQGKSSSLQTPSPEMCFTHF
jgi:hypothetical protein